MPDANNSKRILIVEDESVISFELEKQLNDLGFIQIDKTNSGEKAIKLANSNQPNLILMDINLHNEMDGISTAEEILSKNDIPVIFLTAFDDETILERVKLINPYGYLLKPIKKHELEVAVEVTIYKHEITKKLKQKEKQYRKIFEESAIGICTFNPNGTLENINTAACEILGIANKQNIIGFNIAEDPFIGTAVMQNLTTGQKTCMNIQYDFSKIQKNKIYKTTHKETHILQIHTTPLMSLDNQEREGILLYIFNNTEFYTKEKSLQYQKELLDALLVNIPDKIYFKDSKSRFIKISHNHGKMFNIKSVDEAIGKTDFDFFSNEHAQKAFEDEQNIIKTQTPMINKEEKETWPDGSVTYVSSSKVPVYDNNNHVIGLVGISRDITDLKNSQAALAQSEENYRELFENAPVGYHELNTEGIIINVNQSEADMLQYDKHEMIGKPIFDFLPKAYQQEAKADYKNKINTGQEHKPYERKYLTKSGEKIAVYVQDRIVKDKTGTVIGIRTTLQDISELKKAELQLKKIASDLKQSNEELEQFAYVASHDLQEPLRMIASYVQLLERRYSDELDDTAKEFINFAVDGAKRMQGLINALLVYSRVGTRSKPFTETDINKIVKQIQSDLIFKIKETEAEIKVDPLPIISVDSTQIGQVFQNILSNALKFTKDNKPIIHIGANEDDHYIQFFIKDNGIGIDEKFRERIFMVFQRLHTRQEYEGTGIGLAVCKKIIERHGGKIWIESNPDGGSIFKFTIHKKENKA